MLVAVASHSPAQERPHAFVGARLLPIDGAPIENGTLVVQGGRIVALGTPARVLEPQRLHDVFGVTVDVERDSAGGCFIRYRRPDPRPAKLKLVAEA